MCVCNNIYVYIAIQESYEDSIWKLTEQQNDVTQQLSTLQESTNASSQESQLSIDQLQKDMDYKLKVILLVLLTH